MKFKGTIKIKKIPTWGVPGYREDIVMAIPKIGEFYLDAADSGKCIPTENILKAVNYPKRKRFKVELREHENGLLVFRYSGEKLSSLLSGFYFNNRRIEKFDNDSSSGQLRIKNLISSGVLHSEVVFYNLYINGILINAFEYELSEHANQHHPTLI